MSSELSNCKGEDKNLFGTYIISVLKFTYLGGVDLADGLGLVDLGLALKYCW